MKPDEVMFTCTIKKKIMADFKNEAIKQGVSRVSLLRIWVARAAAERKQRIAEGA